MVTPRIKTERHAGGRPPVSFDLAEAVRLRSEGWSYRRLAGKYHTSKDTVARRIHNWKPAPVQPPAAPVPDPVEPVLPVVEVSMPVEIPPKPAPVPVVPPPEPHGLDSIPAGCKAFFLVRGEQNAIYARGHDQPAVGIEVWHHEYASLPAFQAAERIWMVMNSSEDNRAFLLSIAGDIWIRERCLVSVDGLTVHNPPVRPPDVWVQLVCKFRLLMERPRDGSWPDNSGFEAIFNFQPVPLPSHTDKLAALVAPASKPDRPNPFGGVEEWRWRWSGAK